MSSLHPSGEWGLTGNWLDLPLLEPPDLKFEVRGRVSSILHWVVDGCGRWCGALRCCRDTSQMMSPGELQSCAGVASSGWRPHLLPADGKLWVAKDSTPYERQPCYYSLLGCQGRGACVCARGRTHACAHACMDPLGRWFGADKLPALLQQCQ